MHRPRELRFAPGVRAVPLGRQLVQVGLAHGGAVRLRRSPAVDDLVSALATGAVLPASADPALLDELVRRGVVVPPTAQRPVTVAVVGSAGTDPAPLLEASGLVGTTTLPAADVALVAADGELDRALLVPIARARLPFLPVRLVDGLAVLGPFAVPGRSACLGCVDRHRSADDAAHPVLVERYTGAPAADDPVLGTLATAWAVRDLATWAAGGCPATWSRTVTVDPVGGAVSAQLWWRHPECGCTWGEAPSVTMEE